MTGKLRYVGAGVVRSDGAVLVTGEGLFVGDRQLPHMLHGKILRSTQAHARLVAVDASKAERLPGVKGIVTGQQIPAKRFGLQPDETALAIERVRYLGEPIAAVAAVDEDTAAEALELIRVEYELLPPVFDAEAAMLADAPPVHEKGNISSHLRLYYGDLEQGFADADYVRNDRYTTTGIQHCPMEPHAALAHYDRSGKMTVWVSSQSPYLKRRVLAATLGMQESQIRIMRSYVGGGFGCKVEMLAQEFCAAWLSRQIGAPVKIVYTREEVFTGTRQRHPMVVELKTGVKRDGTITARQCRLVADTGAYNSTGPLTIYLAGNIFNSIYQIPNLAYDGYCVYTNNSVRGPMRGHGATQINFASESQLDCIAHELGLDPLELRRKNVAYPGYRWPTGMQVNSCELQQCLDVIAEQRTSLTGSGGEGKAFGIGIAVGAFTSGNYLGPDTGSGAIIKINEDCTVTLIIGGAEIGQGLDNISRQIAAEELGVPVDAITVNSGDTEVGLPDVGAFASAETLTTGNAIKLAAAELKQLLLQQAAEMLKTDPGDLELANNEIRSVLGGPTLPLRKVVMRAFLAGKPLLGRGYYMPKLDPPHYGDEIKGQVTPAMTYNVQMAAVEVDRNTGQVKVLQLIEALDCGQVINRLQVEGQSEGSIVTGMGQGLSEELLLEEGQLMNSSFLAYGIPIAPATPAMNCFTMDSHEPAGPFGAKEAGESSIVPTAPAIANAVFDAIGVRFNELPITPDKVLRALEKQSRS